jgi:serine protease Do
LVFGNWRLARACPRGRATQPIALRRAARNYYAYPALIPRHCPNGTPTLRHRCCPAPLPGLLLAASLLLLARPLAQAQQAMGAPPDQAELIGNLLPTVVDINAFAIDKSTAAADIDNPAPVHPKPLQGSGLIIDPTGVILTNYHSLAGGYDLHVTFSDGTRLTGRILATAPRIDLALVKVDAPRPLPVARWADSDKVRVGQPVFAIGNALGAGLSVSAGIVSALNRDVNESPYDDLIQTDASINHGNSGGPLFNRNGEVIGVNTAILSPTKSSAGLGFAIPSNEVRFIAGRMLRDGRFTAGYIGIKTEAVTQDMAAALGIDPPGGLIIALMRAGEPAEAAGLQVGDVILRYDNQPRSDERALLRAIAKSTIGQAVPITVLRAGREQTLQVTPGPWPEPEATVSAQAPKPAMLVPPDLGLSLSALTADLRARHGLQTQRGGVLVDDVTEGTDAFDRGLLVGDVILRVQDAEVATPQEVQAAIAAARARHKAFVMALVLSKADQFTGPHWVALMIEAPQ